jgi:hypothetical protein
MNNLRYLKTKQTNEIDLLIQNMNYIDQLIKNINLGDIKIIEKKLKAIRKVVVPWIESEEKKFLEEQHLAKEEKRKKKFEKIRQEEEQAERDLLQ